MLSVVKTELGVVSVLGSASKFTFASLEDQSVPLKSFTLRVS